MTRPRAVLLFSGEWAVVVNPEHVALVEPTPDPGRVNITMSNGRHVPVDDTFAAVTKALFDTRRGEQ